MPISAARLGALREIWGRRAFYKENYNNDGTFALHISWHQKRLDRL